LPPTLDKQGPASVAGSGGSVPEPLPAGRGWGLLRTAALWAVVAFAVVNVGLWLAAGEDRAASRDLWSGSGSIDLAVNDFKQLERRPTVVLLGSSLMMFPFWTMDAERDPKVADIFHHHESVELEHQLSGLGYKNPSVFSFAIFGQMASDAYIYVEEYLKGDRKPDYLVFGIAPRDLSDHDLASPTATFTFKRLVGLSNFARYAPLYLPGWQEQAEFLFSHVCYFYGKRWRLQQEVDKATHKIYKTLGTAAPGKGSAPDAQSGFMMAGTAEQRWENSLKEYRRRYRNIGERDLSVQFGFVSRLLQVCRERGIKVILIDMPLTKANRDLLPPDFYARFRSQLAGLTGSYGARFLDLGDAPEFTVQDYWDTSHLNHHGGHKLVARLLPLLETGRN